MNSVLLDNHKHLLPTKEVACQATVTDAAQHLSGKYHERTSLETTTPSLPPKVKE